MMDRIETDTIAKAAVALHNSYLPLRNPTVPFPAESVAFWCVILAVQAHHGVRGDLLELGVEHGGTAFLSICSLAEGEEQVLLDRTRSSMFAAKYDLLPQHLASAVTFLETSTQSPSTDPLTKRHWRFVHIDAGHSYSDVKADMQRYAGLLGPDGILCCDDFFLNRWPDVTVAILDTYLDAGLAPIALVNRKIYFARKEVAGEARERVKAAKDALTVFGKVNFWEVRLRERPVDFYQILPLRTVGLEPIQHA